MTKAQSSPIVSNPNEGAMQKSIETLMKQQKEFEQRINQTLDETLRNSVFIKKHIEEMKQKEIEMKIQMLKEENINNLKTKIMFESQLDKIRANYSLPMGTLRTPYFHPEGEHSLAGIPSLGKDSISYLDHEHQKPPRANVKTLSDDPPSPLTPDLRQQEEYKRPQLQKNSKPKVPMIDTRIPQSIQSAVVQSISLSPQNIVVEHHAFKSPKFLEVEGNHETDPFKKAPQDFPLESTKLDSGDMRESSRAEIMSKNQNFEQATADIGIRKNWSLPLKDRSQMPTVIVKCASEHFDEIIHQTEGPNANPSGQNFNDYSVNSKSNQAAGNLLLPTEDARGKDSGFIEVGYNSQQGRANLSKQPKSEIFKRYGTKEIGFSEKQSEQQSASVGSNTNITIKDKFVLNDEKFDFDYQSKTSKEDLSFLRKTEYDSPMVRFSRAGSLFSRVDSQQFAWVPQMDGVSFIDDSKETELPQPLTPLELFNNPDYIKFPQKSIITKCIPSAGNCRRIVECRLGKGKVEPVFFISLKQYNSGSEKYEQIAQEIVRFKEFRKILNHIEYKDSLPSTVTIKSIKSYSSFVKYLVIPFIGVYYANGYIS